MIHRRPRKSAGSRKQFSYCPMIWVRDASGRHQVWGGSYRTFAEAKSAERRMLQDRETGATVTPSKLTVADLCKQYLDEKQDEVKESTLVRSRQLLAMILPLVGSLPAFRLTPRDISKAYKFLQTRSAKRTVRHVHWQLHGAFDLAVRWGQLPTNVVAKVDPPTPDSFEGRSLDREELRALLDVARRSLLGPLVMLAIDSGGRQGELLALGWPDVDLDKGEVHIGQSVRRLKSGFAFTDPKTKRSKRTVQISAPTIAVLRAHRQHVLEQRLKAGELWADLDLVFPTDTGRPRDGSFVSRVFKKIAEDAGLAGLRFHDLRHSSVSLLLQSGEPMANVSRRAGHAGISTTVDTYGHKLGTGDSMATTMAEILGGAIADPDRWLANG